MADQKKKVLIVEDEKLAAFLIQKKLENLGYNICGSVVTGEEAIHEASTKKPDAVLMDINLKGEIDGIQAAEAIIKKFNIPVIFVTAFSDRETAEKAKRTSRFGYLEKPVRDDDLREKMRSAMAV